MKNLKLFLLVLSCFSLIIFQSCEENEISDLEITEQKQVVEFPSMENSDIKNFQDLIPESVIEDASKSRSSITVYHSSLVTLNSGKWHGYIFPKSLLQNHDVIFEIIPRYGDPDAYAFGYPGFRYIKHSYEGSGTDKVEVKLSHLNSGESYAALYAYAFSNTQFTYKVSLRAKNTSGGSNSSNCGVDNFPMYRQHNNFTCGQYSVTMLLNHKGYHNVTIEDVTGFIGGSYTDGNDQRNAINHFAPNLSARVGRNWTFDQLKDQICKNGSVLVAVWRHGYGHTFVVRKIDGNNRVYVNDPFYNSNGGKKVFSKSTFLNMWDTPRHSGRTDVAKNVIIYTQR